jgi:heat-inducible transcriptional repressor
VENLTLREKIILRFVIDDFISSATPVGSGFISKNHHIDIGPATIRNVMADLEQRGLIEHPYTSAGRVPTDKGYRYYVDSLMERDNLSEDEQASIELQLNSARNADDILRETSKLLGTISRQLSVVSTPQIAKGIFERCELVSVSTSKLLVVIAMRSGIVKTIMFEIESEIPRPYLDAIATLLNEKLAGLTLIQIRETFAVRLREYAGEQSGLIRLFINSVDDIFSSSKEKEKFHISGTSHILAQPEFSYEKNFRAVIELLNNEDIFLQILNTAAASLEINSIGIIIGEETRDERLQECSVITAQYKLSDVNGSIGIIGPKRMNYARMIPLVEYVASSVTRVLA